MPGENLKKRIGEWFQKDYRMTFLERIELLFESERMFESEPYAVRYGKTLAHTLSNINVFIQEGELFAGSVKEAIPSDEQYEYIRTRYESWWDIPERERQEKMPFYYSEGWLKCRPPWFYSFGHLALDWERIVARGIGDFKREAQARLQEATLPHERDFLSGLALCYDAISGYIARYAGEARRKGLSEMAQSLERIADGSAASLYDALALIWLVTLVCQKVCGCGVLNLGRMDQYLLPLYESDRERGLLDEARALELLEEFFFKHNEIMAQADHMSQETEEARYTLEVAYDDPNYLIIGGTRADAKPGVNGLSRLMLRANQSLGLRNPLMVVRYYEGMDAGFFREVCAAMRANTSLLLYNDGTMLPALKEYGIQEPEAFDYGFYGCNDPDIGAHEGGLRQVWINLAKPLELALNRGADPLAADGGVSKGGAFSLKERLTGLMTEPCPGIDTGDLDAITSIDGVLNIYRKQLDYMIGSFRGGFEEDFAVEKRLHPGRMRIEDCFLIGTLENAETWTLGGTKYHKIVTQGTGIATVADALYAIERLVFKEKRMTLKELAKLLANDFDGDEFLAARLKKKFEKFGNDISGVDKYAAAVAEAFTDAVKRHNNEKYLYQMFPTLSSDRDFTTMGLCVGATADGRRRGERLSENQSPTQGMDISGVTAMLNSVSRLPFAKITGGPLNMRLHPSSVKGEEGLDVLAALLRTYMQNGGMQVQMNVVDADALRKAQAEPQAYRGLCIRVTGYSAFFVEMGKKAQEELIARTELMV